MVTAAKNYVETAKQIAPANPATLQAESALMNAQASDYWYWDGSAGGIWDAHPTRACNTAVQQLQSIVSGGQDQTSPTVWEPQREPYNPGATEWNQQKSSDFTVWSFVHDVSGLQTVVLKYRTDVDGLNPLSSVQNETYAGGNEVGAWQSVNMTAAFINPSTQGIAPIAKASEYSAKIMGLSSVLVDYYIEATDIHGNVTKSNIEHVWVGANNSLANDWANCDTSITGYNPGGGGGGTNPGVSWSPVSPSSQDTITIVVNGATQGAQLHWGVNGWQLVNTVYRPAGTSLWNGTGPAVESPMQGPTNNQLKIKLGPFNNAAQVVNKLSFVIHYNDNTWDNNNSADYHINISQLTNGINTPYSQYLSIYPNPTHSRLELKFGEVEVRQVEILNVLGERVYSQQLNQSAPHLKLNTAAWAKGVYMVRIESDKGSWVEKVVKE